MRVNIQKNQRWVTGRFKSLQRFRVFLIKFLVGRSTVVMNTRICVEPTHIGLASAHRVHADTSGEDTHFIMNNVAFDLTATTSLVFKREPRQ